MGGFKIGVIAPSSVAPRVELRLGIEKLNDLGFSVEVHPQCIKKDFLYAGSARERAHAFLEMAEREDLSVLWCARGGYGANQILPFLEGRSRSIRRGEPKLLIGFSDATAVMGFARERWGWETLHFPMPASASFFLAGKADWQTVTHWLRKERSEATWEKCKMSVLAGRSGKIRAEIVGGNLAVMASLCGTGYLPSYEGKILFLEDIAESWSRVDRMVSTLELAKVFRGVRAIVLGDFLRCHDEAPRFLGKVPGKKQIPRIFSNPRPSELKPVRKKFSDKECLQRIFGELGERLHIPVISGFPSGHGPNFSPIPLGAHIQLEIVAGRPSIAKAHLLHWDWLLKRVR